MRILANPNLHFTSHLWNAGQFLIQKHPMALGTPVCQGGRMHKTSSHLNRHLFRLIQRKLTQVLYFVTLSAGRFVDLLGFSPVFMTLFASGVLGNRKSSIGHFAMAIHAGHSVVGNMQVMAEGEFVFIFLVTASQ